MIKKLGFYEAKELHSGIEIQFVYYFHDNDKILETRDVPDAYL